MCIVITKPSGIKSPNWECITQSCTANPDGFAISWFKEGMEQPEVKRTMNRKDFLEYFKPITEDDSISWMLHARIRSAGSIKLENCHCWRDPNTGLVFCHNGTLSIKPNGDMTDSETFFRHLYIPAVLGGGDGNAVVEACIGSSKFAFMKKNGEIVTYGKYVEDAQYPGVKFSNGSYKVHKTPTTTKTYTNYWGGGYGGWDMDDYDDEYGYYDYSGAVTSTTSKAQYKKPEETKQAHSFLIAHHGWHFFRPNSNKDIKSTTTEKEPKN